MTTLTKIGLWLCGDLFMAQYKESRRRVNKELQIIEDEFVEATIEQVAQDAYRRYMIELDKFKLVTSDPEMLRKFGPMEYVPGYPHVYHVHDSETAKYGHGKIDINEAIKHRYNELRAPTNG